MNASRILRRASSGCPRRPQPLVAAAVILLAVVMLLAGAPGFASDASATTVTFQGTELLGRPTNNSVTVHVVLGSGQPTTEYYYRYGTSPGSYTGQTTPVTVTAGQPSEVLISGLAANTKYYYQMVYDGDGDVEDADFETRTERSFYTQRGTGTGFTFDVTSDSHVNIMLGSAGTWTSTMNNVAADHPDFLIDLGDTFAMDSVTSVSGAETAYLYQRQFFDLVGHSASIYLAPGNHEQQEGWHLDDTGDPATSKPVMGTNAQKKYYLNPVPNAFYTGNTDTYSYLTDDQLHEDYYAWTWGDALFVVIDPYWYTTSKPFVGDTGGGESSDTGTGDRWDWTLGQTQFNWLKGVVEASNAKYKFIFAHHYVGGSDDYVRGGANPAHICEWGGYNENGTTYAWATERAGWGSEPMHDILAANDVTAFIHGHDHQYAYEVRDEVVYVSMPAAGFSGSGFNIYSTGSGYTVQALPSPGHLRVTVGATQATAAYIATSGGGVNHSFTMDANITGPTYTISASAGTGGSISPSGSVVVDQGADQSFAITPDTGYHVADVLVDSVSVGAVTSYEFENVQTAHTIAASFALNTYTITASDTTNGSISPSGAVTVNHGANQTFTITPSFGCHVADVLVDGSSVGAVTSYTFTNVTTNHTIAASFAVNTYTITASAGSGGSISPNGAVSVGHGASQTFTITPAASHHIVDVLVDGSSVGAVTSYQFVNVQAAHTIAASFAIDEYTITASAGSGGSISPSGVVGVGSGSSQTFTITPAANYHVADVLVDGSSVGAVSTYTFTNITANHTIAASFALNTHTITATAGLGGSISPSGTVSVAHGADQTFTIIPNTGYNVAGVLVDGSAVGTVTTYTFDDVSTDHTISVSFTIKTYTITASAATGGSISPSGAVSVTHGANQVFTITPASGFHVSGVNVDGGPVGAVTTYSFTNVTANHTIAAYFSSNATVYTSIRGIHRYETAQLISQALFPTALPAGSGCVVAPGETFQEALCGAPLAAAYGGPVLLTTNVGLENGTEAELQRLFNGTATPTIFVIGLSSAIRDEVAAAVPAATVVWIRGPVSGSSVYEMSHQVATYMELKLGDGNMTDATAIITIGTNFPDAIGVGPLACANLWPILLTDQPGDAALQGESAAALSQLGITKAIKVGTYATLPVGIDGLINLSGTDRYVTNANVANWAKANAGLSFVHTAVATGDKFPDALASGPYLAKDDGILVLSPLLGPLPPVIATVLSNNAAQVQHVTFIACIEPVISQVKEALD